MSAKENIFVKRKFGPSIKNFLVYLCENPHNNLPQIVEVCDEYYVMEYINGVTLTEFAEKEEITVSVAKKFILQLVDAVEVLHKFNIVHRDINPDNIIITADGTLKLIDFDIAREIVKNKSKDTQILGTVGYAAPEQFGFTQTDERSDIYAIGVLYEFLVGDKLDVNVFAHSQIRKIISKCTEIDQKKRYRNLVKLRRDVATEFFTSYSFFDIVPGFRTGNILKMIFATSVYMISLFVYFVVVVEEMPQTGLYDSVIYVLIVIIYLAYTLLFFAVGTNFLNIIDRIKLPFKKKWKKQVFVLAVMYILASIVSAAIAQDISGTLLGNPINVLVAMYFYMMYSIISPIVVGML